MIFSTFIFLIALALLLYGANIFIQGSSDLAQVYKISPLVVGIFIVGFGTSTPELFVSCFGALQGKGEIAIGNAIGSNIVNIGLILGLTAIFRPLKVESNLLKKEVPCLLGVTCLVGILLYDGILSRIESLVLLLIFLIYTLWVTLWHKDGSESKDDSFVVEIESKLKTSKTVSLRKPMLSTFGGLTLLIISSQGMVWSASNIATYFKINELIIGLTIVAIGTSLPELAASVIAARKGASEIAFGNVIGSNMFNSMMVLGVPGLISGSLSVPRKDFLRDYVFLLILTVLVGLMGIGTRGEGRINRSEGGILLTIYLIYNILLLRESI